MPILLIATSRILLFSLILCWLSQSREDICKTIFQFSWKLSLSFTFTRTILWLSIVFLNLHFKVAELNTVFKCLCLTHNSFLTIYTWCPFFAKGKVTQRKVYWGILARVCVAVDESKLSEGIKNVSCLFKSNPVVWFFHHLSTTTSHKSSLSTLLIELEDVRQNLGLFLMM